MSRGGIRGSGRGSQCPISLPAFSHNALPDSVDGLPQFGAKRKRRTRGGKKRCFTASHSWFKCSPHYARTMGEINAVPPSSAVVVDQSVTRRHDVPTPNDSGELSETPVRSLPFFNSPKERRHVSRNAIRWGPGRTMSPPSRHACIAFFPKEARSG